MVKKIYNTNMATESFNTIKLEQSQRLQLNHQLLQSLSVLCMNNIQLGSYIDELYQSNPCIEKSDPQVPEDIMRILSEFGTSDSAKQGSEESEESDSRYELSENGVDDLIGSLGYEVKSQIEKLELNEKLKAVCIYLSDMIDDNGMLTRENLDYMIELGVPEELVRNAANVIKRLNPAGVGAEDAAEFIRLQLERYYPDEKIAIKIASSEYIGELAEKKYQAIADSIGVEVEQVIAASEIISGLNSSITTGYSYKEQTVYIRPDIYIYKDNMGELCVISDEYNLPKVTVNAHYLEIYKTTDDKELKLYLKKKIEETYDLIKSLERRESTLKRCFNYIVENQKEFFLGKSEYLKPMTMSDAAYELNLNVSSISRAFANKHVQCPAGIFSAGWFFSRALNRADSVSMSVQKVKKILERIILQEDKKHPLSDAKICNALKTQGININRRTVTKYRQSLNIKDYRIRKMEKTY